MLLLASTGDLLRVVTSAAVTTDVHASWCDLSGGTVTPGRTNTAISTATTTTVVGSPAAATYRTVKSLTVRNRHATTAQTVTLKHTDGSTDVELIKVTLAAGECLHYHEAAGFWIADSQGASKTNSNNNGSGAAVNALNLVVLSSDVVNNSAVANTMQDVTGLSFDVTAGETYFFEFTIPYTAAATTTGSRWAINGPASPTLLSYTSQNTLTATSMTTNYASAYDTPAASNASSLTAGNIALICGFIKPSTNGTVIARFASEVASSAITAKAGALLKWYRTQ
jgi:hypothetical protein